MNFEEELKKYEGKMVSLIREPEYGNFRCPVLGGKAYLQFNEGIRTRHGVYNLTLK